jgi:(1->4)-alpha-D-glucan 1-alpha-D-glucosylmutase
MQTVSNLLNGTATDLCDCFARLSAEKLESIPLSTYRLQFNNRFHFQDALDLIPYLQKLGITHLYSSPILKAREGSQHGYDIIDHNQVNPEIGTEEEFRQLATELRARGMGLLLDIVPNHMGVGYGNNPWWQDVLQNGRTSSYAEFFDIDWEPLKVELRNKVMLPILGQAYGADLEAGNIKVIFEGETFLIKYSDKMLPIDPQTIPLVFTFTRHNGDDQSDPSLVEFNLLINSFARLPANNATEPEEVRRRQDEIPGLLDQLRRLALGAPMVRTQIDAALEVLNGRPGQSHSFDALHELLEKQAYRLAFWRVSGEEINYRRFFDINDLVGLRMENPRVFAETHKLIRKFLGENLIAGLRLDHPDGLLNPSQYIMRLQRLCAAGRCIGADPVPPLAADGIELEVHSAFGQQQPDHEHAPLYLLVEKILEAGEHLPDFWPVAGSVGYDFTNSVNGIFIDGRHERLFTKLYEQIIGGTFNAEKLIYESKRLVMRRALSSEVSVLAHMLNEISNQDRRARDFTLGVLREAIRETIACFPVYRTYIDERAHVSDSDRKYIQQAIACAKRKNGTLAPAVFDFLQSILLLEDMDSDGTVYGYRRKLYFTLKFQQLTGPVMAKGLEDTACYVYNRFVSVNEVGGSPTEFGTPVSEFHGANQDRAEQWPHSMLTTSTHDTKRSEDVRARLDVLSEIPSAWATQVMKWRRINRGRKGKLADGRSVPDNNEEYLLYQTLVGAWPLEMRCENECRGFVGRVQQYMEKAIHEAKVNLSWLNPNQQYADAMNSFVEEILSPAKRKGNLFLDSLQKFIPPVIYFGLINSLGQTALKLTSPGVPDVYQGQELWDFSLVDPDNRRHIDFESRKRLLDQLTSDAREGSDMDLCDEMLRNCRDGRLKMWVTSRALNFRRKHKDLFQKGSYLPLRVRRGREEHVVAFARRHSGNAAITVVPRLSYTLMKGKEEPPIGAVWGDSELALPPEAIGRRVRNIFTGESFDVGESILCREVFSNFPVAVLALG